MGRSIEMPSPPPEMPGRYLPMPRERRPRHMHRGYHRMPGFAFRPAGHGPETAPSLWPTGAPMSLPLSPPSPASPEPLPLRARYVLHPGDTLALSRLRILNAVENLRAFAYRPRLVKALSQESLWLNRSAVLASHAPILRLERPWSLDQLPASLALLRDHWTRL